jgi:hypothetical protein
MNERIRKLMDGCFDVTVDSRGREECTADYINVEKFADRIIMECAELAEECYCGDTVKSLIMNHFGIEP